MNTLRLAALTASIVVSSAIAQTDGLLCHFDRVVGVAPAADLALDVAVSGNFMFVADRFAGVRVFDISDPTNPSLTGSVALSGARRIVHNGDIVLVGTESVGLRRISVADPTAPSSLGRVELDQPCWDLAVEGDTTYVANLSDGLKIIHTPQSGPMSVLSTYTPTGGYAVRSVAVRDGLAAVAHDNGVDFVDVSDPASPQIVSVALGLAYSPSVALGDGAAYVAIGSVQGGTRIIDLTDPATPVDAGSLDIDAIQLRVLEDKLYASTGNGIGRSSSLLTLDLSDPLSPVLSGAAIGSGANFAINGGHVFGAAGSGVTITNLTPPLGSPFRRTGTPALPSTAIDVAHVAASPDKSVGYYRRPATQNEPARLYVIDLDAEPGSPPLGVLDLPHPNTGADDIKAGNGVVYLSGFQQPVTVVDTSDPANPVIAGDTGSPSGVQELIVQNEWVYGLGLGFAGIAVHDATVSGQLQHLGNISLPGSGRVTALTPIGNDLLVAGRSFTGIQVLDASNPPALPVIGSLGGFPVTGLTTQGDIVFALNYRDPPELRAIDLSDPANPVLLGQYEWDPVWMFMHAGLIEPAGDGLLAVSLTIGQIEIMDVSDPTDIKPAGTLPAGTFEFASAGPDRLILQVHGLTIVDTSQCAACPGDFNGDGVLNFFDISAYLQAFNDQDPSADLAEPFGVFNFFDLAAYLDLYNAGCP